MAYKVRTDVFEGPLDLLLTLISKQKVDVHEVSLATIADEYVAHIEGLAELDLDVASEFLLVAATLLQIKAASLLPRDVPDLGEEFDELSPEEARDLLVARLLAYKQFKNVANELAARMEGVARVCPRYAGLEEPFLKLMPDYLEGITLRTFGVICADLHRKREVFLLEAEHVAAAPIPVDVHMRHIRTALAASGKTTFSELVPAGASVAEFVVVLLAVLELYKRGAVSVTQDGLFGEIEVAALDLDAVESFTEEHHTSLFAPDEASALVEQADSSSTEVTS